MTLTVEINVKYRKKAPVGKKIIFTAQMTEDLGKMVEAQADARLEDGTLLTKARGKFIIILTGILGTYLIKSQGFMILRKIQNDLNEGIMPVDSLIQGAIILLGGVLLLTPGFITDITGFIFLMPAGRKIVKKYLWKWLKGKIKEDNFYFREF
jgi:UPF0716 protein FxsA